jgi:hypothetical protein
MKYYIRSSDGSVETLVQVTQDKSTGILHDGTHAYYPYGKDNDAYRIGALIINNGKITNVKLFSNTTSEHKEYIAKHLAQAKARTRSGK